MSYSITQQDNDISYNIVQYVVNTREDVNTVPTSAESGSTIFCIEDSSVWMLTCGTSTSSKEWKEI